MLVKAPIKRKVDFKIKKFKYFKFCINNFYYVLVTNDSIV